MTLRTRLVLVLAALTGLLVIPALYAGYQLARVRDIAFEQRGRHADAFLSLGRVQANLSELERFQRSYIAAPGEDLRRGTRTALDQTLANLQRLGDSGYGETSQALRFRLDTLRAASARVDSLMESGAVESATTYFQEIKPIFTRAQADLDPIAAAIDERSRRDLRQASTISDTAATATLFAILVCLLVAVALGAWTTRGITSPLLRLRSATAAVAGGEFVSPQGLPYDRQDELGDLSRSFRAMTDRLAELDRLRAEFVSMASHELKTPINVIAGYAQLMEEGVYGELNEKQRAVLDSIVSQTRTLTNLVNQLLDISRLEAGSFPIHMREVEPAELLSDVRRTFEPLAQQKEIEFRVEAMPSLPEKLVLDPDRLRNEVLGNLLSNAFKFTPQGGWITVRAWAEDDSTHFRVEDSGVGIPDDQLPFIFDKFYQVGEDARSQGTGLGLAIARQIVESHDGEIHAESQEGRGTAFHVVLPARMHVENEYPHSHTHP